MKRAFLRHAWLLLTAFSSCGAVPAHAQYEHYVIGTVAGTGQLGAYIDYSRPVQTPPSTYTLDWNFSGTAASACTFQVEGSSDLTHWYALTAPTDCTAGNMLHIVYKPVVYARVNVLTYTAGNGTTAVTFNYTRGGR